MISWNKAYAVFPQATFIDRRGIILQELNDNRVTYLQKYIRRGFSFHSVPPGQAKSMPAIEQDRRVADCHSWIIQLDTVGIAGPSLPDWSLEYAGINLKKSLDFITDGRISEGRLERYTVNMVRVKSYVLRREYLCASHQWARFLADQADRASGIELSRADNDARSLGWRDVINLPADMAYEQSTWEFWDDQVPAWFAQWQELQTSKAAPGVVDRRLRARLKQEGASATVTEYMPY